jgi:hypothetical protein
VWSIVLKEYRQRARGKATVGLIMTYTVILGAVAFFLYATSYVYLVGRTKSAGDVGMAMAIAVFITQMIMALLLSLSLNASSIASEKDQETFDLLNLTLFKSYEVVIGKYLSSTGFLFILVVTALPIYALAFTFGGVALEAFWQLAAVVVGMTLFISSLGLLLSLISDDVRTALGRSFFLLIVFGLITGVFGAILQGSFDQAPPNVFSYWLGLAGMLLNPLWAAQDVFSPLSIQWPAPQPVVVPFLVSNGLLWAYSAATQATLALMIVAITSLIYPRYRAGKPGGVS